MLAIQLTTPFQVDSRVDPNNTYTHAVIANKNDLPHVKRCDVTIVLGWVDENDKFYFGVASSEDYKLVEPFYRIIQGDYDSVMNIQQGNDPDVGTAINRSILNWLVTNGYFEGTIVDGITL